jgi:hypothetical protein
MSADRPVPGPATDPVGDAPHGLAEGDRLDPDEWQFLRATPDYDAEEMSGVSLPVSALAAPGWSGELKVSPSPLLSPEEFPEAGSLSEMLGELLDTEDASPGAEAETTWSEVPAAQEWADLMGSRETEARTARGPTPPVGAPLPSPATGPRGWGLRAEPPAPPAARDVLSEALAGFEQVGRFPNPSPNKHLR